MVKLGNRGGRECDTAFKKALPLASRFFIWCPISLPLTHLLNFLFIFPIFSCFLIPFSCVCVFVRVGEFLCITVIVVLVWFGSLGMASKDDDQTYESVPIQNAGQVWFIVTCVLTIIVPLTLVVLRFIARSRFSNANLDASDWCIATAMVGSNPLPTSPHQR